MARRSVVLLAILRGVHEYADGSFPVSAGREMRYSRVLVTGDQGFIGSHAVRWLLQMGVSVVGVDIAPCPRRVHDAPHYVHHQGSIDDPAVMTPVLKDVEAVLHFAGVAEPHLYAAEPRRVIEANAMAGMSLIRACAERSLPLLLSSTSEIYGKSAALPFHEDGDRVLGPTSVDRWNYATSKALLEHYLAACARDGGISYVAARLFNVYGPRLKGRVVGRFVEAGLAGEDLVVHGDGRQTRAFTYIDDALAAMLALLNLPALPNQAVNVGSERETSVLTLARTVRALCGGRSKVRHVPHCAVFPSGHEDTPRRRPDVSRLYDLAGWRAWTPLRDGLSRMISAERAARLEPPPPLSRRREPGARRPNGHKCAPSLFTLSKHPM